MGRNGRNHQKNASIQQRRQRRHSIGTFVDADGNPCPVGHFTGVESRGTACDVILENDADKTDKNGEKIDIIFNV